MSDILEEIARARNVVDVDACRELLVRAHRVIYDQRAEVAKQDGLIREARAVNARLAGADKEKYAVVPLDPTDDMLAAAMMVSRDMVTVVGVSERNVERNVVAARYAAMVNTAARSHGAVKDRRRSPQAA